MLWAEEQKVKNAALKIHPIFKTQAFVRCFLYCLLLALLNGFPAEAQVAVRPASQIRNDTIDWMKKVADWQLTQTSWDSSVTWERGALHAGLMACYEATKDETYLDKCRQYAQKFNWQLGSTSHHADYSAVGQVYMELYLLDQQDPARYQGTSLRFKEVSDGHVALWPTFNCNTTSDSNVWWWCDALFMAPPGLVRLSRATGDSSYTGLMHKMWADTQNCLYDTTEHLFFRDIAYFYPGRQNCNGDKMFWSRGNGWVLAGTARVLQYLPLDDPNRSRYTTLLQEMSGKLKDIQQPDGYWHSDLLGPACYNNPESSGTGFFTFGIGWGINNGLLDEATYWPTVETGWEALKAAVQPSGLLGWVQPVGAGPTGTNAATTDVFGVGAYLLAGSEVLKYQLSHDPNSIEYFESYTTDSALQAAWIDGDTNGSSGQVTLGDYGDNFMQLSYANGQSPYRSQTDYTFTASKNLTLNNAGYLSILVRGNASNAADVMYVRLEDSNADSAVQIMTEPNVVRTAGWMELGFPLSEFTGINLTQIQKISIGVGLPDAATPTGAGTLRIDNIRLFPKQCIVIPEDFTGDCMVDMDDFAVFAGQWLDNYAETINPTDPGTANLVAYWPLDGNYNDASGNGHNAAAIGGNLSFVNPGHLGQSVDFDAVSALNCANSANVTLSSGGTVSAWIKSGNESDTYASVVTKGFNAWRLMRNNNSSAISFHFNGTGGQYQANGAVAVLDNQWHHLMGIYDGSTVRLYVDGQLDGTGAAGSVNVTNDPVYIGSRSDNLSGRAWNGQIDEVRIYNTALSQANLLYLAESDPIVQLPSQRPADLVYDGVINLDDLRRFVESWAQDSYWP
jgi:unsaturated rhamnogalacturonyl hydrolase